MRIILVLIALSLLSVSCANRPAMAMSRYLISNEKYVTTEMMDSVASSAERCGFRNIEKKSRNAVTLIFYVHASTEAGNLGVGLVEGDYGISVIEGDNNRGINQGFDADSAIKLACFEQELNKQLPNMFNAQKK